MYYFALLSTGAVIVTTSKILFTTNSNNGFCEPIPVRMYPSLVDYTNGSNHLILEEFEVLKGACIATWESSKKSVK